MESDKIQQSPSLCLNTSVFWNSDYQAIQIIHLVEDPGPREGQVADQSVRAAV